MEWVVLESSQHPALAYGLLPAALPSTPATPLLQTPAQQPLPASARFELTCAGTLGSSAASRLLPCPVFYRGLVLPSLTHADPTVTRPKCVHRHSFPIHSLIPHLHSFFPFEQKTSFHPHIVILSTQSKQSTPAAAISDSDDDSDSDSNTIRPKDSRHSSRPPGVPPQQSTEKRSCVRPPPLRRPTPIEPQRHWLVNSGRYFYYYRCSLLPGFRSSLACCPVLHLLLYTTYSVLLLLTQELRPTA